MKHDVFISYKSELIGLVEKFANNLENQIIDGHQIRCWYAPRNLDEGATEDDFDDEILNAIKECNMAVAFINDAALNSKWVKFEIDQAWERGKFILPTAVENFTTDNAVVAKLSSKHRINAYPNPEGFIDKIIQKTIAQLKNGFGEKDEKEPVFKKVYNSHDFDRAQALEEAGELLEAVKLYLQVALQNHIGAQDCLCRLFFEHERTLGEICRGEETNIIRQQADKGVPWACFLMHCIYYDNLNNNEDNIKSFKYCEYASQDGNIPLAWLRLGIHYGWGIGVRQDHALEMLYYKKAYEEGCVKACSYIGQKFANGDDKTDENIEEAKNYYRKGAEQGDRRCMKKLTWLFLDEDDTVKAREVAQRMLEMGYNYGYVLLGVIAEQEGDNPEAIKMYKQAIKLDEYEACGNLAIYHWNHDNREEAFRLVNKGCKMNDTGSYYNLADFNILEKKYDDAWDAILFYYRRCGIGAEIMGELFFDCGYRKSDPSAESVMEQQLSDALEVCARNGNEESMNYLLQLIALQETGEEEPTTDTYMSIPRALEMVKIGAHMKMPSMMCHYGFMLMNDDYPHNNPLKGLQYLEDAALASDEDAMNYLFYYGREGKYAQDVDLPKLAFHAMIFSQMEMDNELRYLGLQCAIRKLKENPDSWLQSRCREILDEMRVGGALGYVKRLGDDLFIFYPDYDELLERKRFLDSGERESLYYIINYASEYENGLELLDRREMRPSYDLSMLWIDGLKDFCDLYTILCTRYNIGLLFLSERVKNLKYDYLPSLEAQKINIIALRSIVQMSHLYGIYQDEILKSISDISNMFNIIRNMDVEDKDLKKLLQYATLLHQESMKVLHNNSKMEPTKPRIATEEVKEKVELSEEIVNPKAFVCCQENRNNIAERLVEFLQQAGIDCWYEGHDAKDVTDRNAAINDAIDNCKIAIAIIDNAAVESPKITKDLLRVYNLNKPIVPFVVGAVNVRNNLTAKIAKFRKIYAYPHPEFYFNDAKLRVEQWLEKYED